MPVLSRAIFFHVVAIVDDGFTCTAVDISDKNRFRWEACQVQAAESALVDFGGGWRFARAMREVMFLPVLLSD